MRLSFAGRNSELEQLRTLYLQGRHVLIVGPPGIGKTALLNEFRTRAPLLICKDTSKITSICSGLEQELGRGASRFERPAGRVMAVGNPAVRTPPLPALWPIWRVLIGGPVVQANTVRFP